MNPLRPPAKVHRAYIVQGLAFGDEGKGSMVDYLCRAHGAPLVVRYNGAAQATHNVVQPDGTHHMFRQFGSGMFVPEVRTFLSRHVLIEPFEIMAEAEVLEGKGIRHPLESLFVDPECLIITPYHLYANRILELANGANRQGSSGNGLGGMREEALHWGIGIQVKDILIDAQAERMLDDIRVYKLKQLRGYWGVSRETDKLLTELSSGDPRAIAENYKLFARSIRPRSWAELAESHRDASIVFEGASGTLLDQRRGFAPYVTPFNTTFDDALELCQEAELPPVRIGVLRTHFTRRGAGPFVSEDRALSFPDHNICGEGQQRVRFGDFDFVAARFAINCCGGIDGLALTHVDCVDSHFAYVDGYRDSHGFTSSLLKADAQALLETGPAGLNLQPVVDRASLVSFIELRLGCKVLYSSSGPTYQDKANWGPAIDRAVAA